MAEPTVRDDPQRDRYEVWVGDGLAGFVDYRDRPPRRRSFVHTEVEPAFEGQGLGSVLVRGALDAARADGRDVLPYCPFVLRWVQRHPEYLDLVPASDRERFGLPAAG